MTTPAEPHLDDEIKIDLLKVFRGYRQFILGSAVVAAVIVATIGALYLVWQPVTTTASLTFRPTFAGADKGEYPNKLPFGPGDFTAAQVLDQVFDKNRIQDYCGRDAFRSGFFVEQHSTALSFLAADYEARLADAKMSAIERTRLQAEYESKRVALPLGYALVFVKSASCHGIPTVIMNKALADVLSVWAEDSESRRGVLKLNVDVLTPNSLDLHSAAGAPPIVRAYLVLSGLKRLIDNVDQVRLLPGASLVKAGEKQLSFLEVRNRLEDLAQSGLEPLVIAAGRGMGGDSIAWANEVLASSVREQKQATSRAQAYLDALREYSGVTNPPPTLRQDSRQTPAGPSDVQTQIDRTFIDRIVELSAPNMLFRQELTRSMVDASEEVIRQQGKVLHYQHLAEVISKSGSSNLTPAETENRLQAIVDEGKGLAKNFDELYAEFSRVSLRASAAMYQVDGVQAIAIRNFTIRSYVLSIVGTFLLTLLLAAVASLVRSRFNSASVGAD